MQVERREGYTLLVGGPVPRGAAAITLGRWISVRRAACHNEHLLRHELAHVRQWRELGWLGFLRRYLAAYLAGRLRGLGHWDAYRQIPLEVEAEAEAVRGTARADVGRQGSDPLSPRLPDR